MVSIIIKDSNSSKTKKMQARSTYTQYIKEYTPPPRPCVVQVPGFTPFFNLMLGVRPRFRQREPCRIS